MNHNNKAFVKDLLSWANGKFDKKYKDVVIISSGLVSDSITFPGTLIISKGHIEYQAKFDLELKVILTKHGY